MNAKKLMFLADELRTLCNNNSTATASMVHTAHMMREELAEYIQEIQPEVFDDLPNPIAKEEDGFPALGNRVYHPIVDKCFSTIVKRVDLTDSNVYAVLIEAISAGF